MFHLLGFLFIIIIAILFIGLSIIGTVLRSIFGFGGRRSSGTYQSGNASHQSDGGYSFNGRQQANSSRNEETISEQEEDSHKHKKLFAKDEGEYVDFEEIKD